MSESSYLHVYIPNRMIDFLSREAQRQGIRRSHLVRNLVEREMSYREDDDAREAAQKARSQK